MKTQLSPGRYQALKQMNDISWLVFRINKSKRFSVETLSRGWISRDRILAVHVWIMSKKHIKASKALCHIIIIYVLLHEIQHYPMVRQNIIFLVLVFWCPT